MAPASLSQKTLEVPFSVCFYKTVVQVGLKLTIKVRMTLKLPNTGITDTLPSTSS